MFLKTLIIGSAFAALAAGAPAAQADSSPSTSSLAVVRSADACVYPAFGYLLESNCSGLWGLDLDGDGDYDEYFAIRTDRVVVHVWPGSGGWRQLANGRADEIVGGGVDRSTGYRLIEVWVNGSGFWCTSYMPGRNWYNFWKC